MRELEIERVVKAPIGMNERRANVVSECQIQAVVECATEAACDVVRRYDGAIAGCRRQLLLKKLSQR